MSDDRRRAVVAFNGEIYNFPDLKAALEKRCWTFESTSDTEVLLKGYLEYGYDVLDKLNGIFAFAIHDVRDATTFIARDHLGVKPLYLVELADTVLFASELKALLVDARVSRELDHRALLRYLTFLWSPGVATPLQAVRRLEPGTAILIRSGRIVRSWGFYAPRFGNIISRSPEEYAADVAERLRTAVHRQMVADVPVGAFLSGGLDSSSIVAFAREKAGPAGMDCFTIAPQSADMAADGMTEDLPYARRVASHLGVRLHTIPIGHDIIRHLGRVLYHLDEPQADPAAINVMLIASLAREHGIKVLLGGTGGDDLFTGYRRHRAFQAEKYWSWLPLHVRSMLAAGAGRLPPAIPSLRRAQKALRDAAAGSDARLFGYFHWSTPQLAATLLARPVDVDDVDEPLATSLVASTPVPKGLDRLLFLEQRFFLADHNLLYTDKLSMASGVEVRVPFLDLDLVAYANQIPSSVKQRGAVGKWVLKKAMEPFLPHDVIYRPKTGFGAPLRSWVRCDLVPVIDKVLSESALRRRGVFAPTVARALIESDRAGHTDAAYTVFSMLCIELWMQIFLDHSEPAPIDELPGMV
jgi:asparagine synthase (glutamine-hydrolysing)